MGLAVQTVLFVRPCARTSRLEENVGAKRHGHPFLCFRFSLSLDWPLGERWSSRSNRNPRQERRSRPLAPAQKCDPLEKVHILLVLEQGAVQRRDELLGVALAERLWRNVLIEQKLEPIEQLRSGRLLFQSRRVTQREERPHGLFDQPWLDRRVVRFDDPAHRLGVRKADVMKETAAQESV